MVQKKVSNGPNKSRKTLVLYFTEHGPKHFAKLHEKIYESPLRVVRGEQQTARNNGKEQKVKFTLEMWPFGAVSPLCQPERITQDQ